jgi:hypothetical protein
MANFAVFVLTNNGLSIRPLVAADLPAAEALIEAQLTRTLRTGLPLYGGQPALEPAALQAQGNLASSIADGEVLIGISQLDAGAKITPGVNPATPVSNWNNRRQPAIADLPTFTVTSIAQANTAIQAIRTSYNTLLTELRAAGLIAP